MRADYPGTSTAIAFCFYFSWISFPSSPLSQRSFCFLPLRLLAAFYLFHQSTSFSFFRALFPGCHFWPCQLLYAQQSLPSLLPPRCHYLGHISLPCCLDNPILREREMPQNILCPSHSAYFSSQDGIPAQGTELSFCYGQFTVMARSWKDLSLYMEWNSPHVFFCSSMSAGSEVTTLLNLVFIILPLFFYLV